MKVPIQDHTFESRKWHQRTVDLNFQFRPIEIPDSFFCYSDVAILHTNQYCTLTKAPDLPTRRYHTTTKFSIAPQSNILMTAVWSFGQLLVPTIFTWFVVMFAFYPFQSLYLCWDILVQIHLPLPYLHHLCYQQCCCSPCLQIAFIPCLLYLLNVLCCSACVTTCIIVCLQLCPHLFCPLFLYCGCYCYLQQTHAHISHYMVQLIVYIFCYILTIIVATMPMLVLCPALRPV